MKRLFDFTLALTGLVLLSPLLLVFMLLIWLQDFHSPLYIAPRMRRKGVKFKMVKLRSMVVNADKMGGTSTAGTDKRITWVGRTIRRYKLDEFSQLWNVLIGEMSLVGPRPQAEQDAKLYTATEDDLFKVQPGITDFASIVFSDEGEILKNSDNPDLRYNQVIRPWKSRLGLFYVENHSFFVDLRLIVLTIVAIFSKKLALNGVQKLLKKLGADRELIEIASRKRELVPYPPPGAEDIVSEILYKT